MARSEWIKNHKTTRECWRPARIAIASQRVFLSLPYTRNLKKKKNRCCCIHPKRKKKDVERRKGTPEVTAIQNSWRILLLGGSLALASRSSCVLGLFSSLALHLPPMWDAEFSPLLPFPFLYSFFFSWRGEYKRRDQAALIIHHSFLSLSLRWLAGPCDRISRLASYYVGTLDGMRAPIGFFCILF